MIYLIARYWPHILMVVISAAIVASIAYAVGDASGDRRAAKAELALSHAQRDAAYRIAEAGTKAREAERRMVEQLAALDIQYQTEIENAQGRNVRRVADLVSGNLRLRHEIAAYATDRLSRDTAAAGELGEAAQRGAALVGAAVAVGAECDARQRALIDAYKIGRDP